MTLRHLYVGIIGYRTERIFARFSACFEIKVSSLRLIQNPIEGERAASRVRAEWMARNAAYSCKQARRFSGAEPEATTSL